MDLIVNERSIMSLKRRALRRSKTLVRDVETQENTRPSRLSALSQKMKAPFTAVFWEDKLEQTDDETLVDGKLLSYAYLEAGVIEMLGSLVTLFVTFLQAEMLMRFRSQVGSVFCCLLQTGILSNRSAKSAEGRK